MGIKDTFHRKPSLSYDCPHCGERLKSPLMDAGTEDTCPHCHQTFAVPGENEKQEYEKEKQAHQDKRAAEQDAKYKAQAERRAKERAVDPFFREQQESDEKQAITQRRAASEAFEKACPAGWFPLAMVVVGVLIFFFFAFV